MCNFTGQIHGFGNRITLNQLTRLKFFCILSCNRHKNSAPMRVYESLDRCLELKVERSSLERRRSERLTFNVEPLGPISRCRRFTNRSLFLTRVPILMMSQATSSSNIRTAWEKIMMRTFNNIIYTCTEKWDSCAALCPAMVTCSKGTLLANSLIKSLAFMTAYGSNVFFVVHTEMLPSIRSRDALMC